MRGPAILLVVLGSVALLLWLALAGGEDADKERGRNETDAAFARVQQELEALQPQYLDLIARGRKLALKEQHDALRAQLAVLRSEQVALLEDPDLPRRRRLPELVKLVERADALLAQARLLHQQIDARHAFIEECSPLLAEARALRDALVDFDRDDVETATRLEVRALAEAFAVSEQAAAAADRAYSADLQQGRLLGQATLEGLRGLIADQQALLERLRAR